VNSRDTSGCLLVGRGHHRDLLQEFQLAHFSFARWRGHFPPVSTRTGTTKTKCVRPYIRTCILAHNTQVLACPYIAAQRVWTEGEKSPSRVSDACRNRASTGHAAPLGSRLALTHPCICVQVINTRPYESLYIQSSCICNMEGGSLFSLDNSILVRTRTHSCRWRKKREREGPVWQ
jgi:hypothetical protein